MQSETVMLERIQIVRYIIRNRLLGARMQDRSTAHSGISMELKIILTDTKHLRRLAHVTFVP